MPYHRFWICFEGHFNQMACTNTAIKDPTNEQVKMKIHNEHLNFRDSFNWVSGDCKFETTEGLSVNEFCLNIHEDFTFSAEVCEKIMGDNRYRYVGHRVCII